MGRFIIMNVLSSGFSYKFPCYWEVKMLHKVIHTSQILITTIVRVFIVKPYVRRKSDIPLYTERKKKRILWLSKYRIYYKKK